MTINSDKNRFSHCRSIREVKAGDYILFVNRPNSWSKDRKNFRTVEVPEKDSIVGEILSEPKYFGGVWALETNLQLAAVEHRNDLFVCLVTDEQLILENETIVSSIYVDKNGRKFYEPREESFF